jgi:hypothetical protein
MYSTILRDVAGELLVAYPEEYSEKTIGVGSQTCSYRDTLPQSAALRVAFF